MNPLVSIVMLAWNRKNDVLESLMRIREIQYSSIEIIVVDNGSTDGTQQLVKEQFPEVELIALADNVGIAAYNIGFDKVKGEYIVIIDDDSFPEKQSIARMVERFREDPQLGIVAFDVRNYYNYDDINNTANIAENNSTAASAKNYYMSFNGAGAGIRAAVFRQVGYYPEEFFLYNNELDVAFRIWDAGYKIRFFSDIVAYHKFSPTNRSSWRAPFYYTRNAFWLIWKNYPAELLLKATIQLIYYCFYYSLEQRTWIYVKSLVSAVFHISKIRGKRKPVRKEVALNLRVPFNINFTFYR